MRSGATLTLVYMYASNAVKCTPLCKVILLLDAYTIVVRQVIETCGKAEKVSGVKEPLKYKSLIFPIGREIVIDSFSLVEARVSF